MEAAAAAAAPSERWVSGRGRGLLLASLEAGLRGVGECTERSAVPAKSLERAEAAKLGWTRWHAPGSRGPRLLATGLSSPQVWAASSGAGQAVGARIPGGADTWGAETPHAGPRGQGHSDPSKSKEASQGGPLTSFAPSLTLSGLLLQRARAGTAQRGDAAGVRNPWTPLRATRSPSRDLLQPLSPRQSGPRRLRLRAAPRLGNLSSGSSGEAPPKSANREPAS